ncbi:MAG: fibronectin-binding domain-containing protein [Gemmatimonadetes bacterium]|nr:fibronectin-binding domain-containing protein [Gemmatimonadota bacterium]MYB59770.1 fibronectin-binding domain-containing protein [Gemmatimonadota bacterium]
MDALVLQAVKDESRELEGSRIVAVEQHAPMEIGLVLKTSTGRRVLSLSVQPSFSRVHLSDAAKKGAASSALLAALRDHLVPGVLEKVDVAPFERVVQLHCRGRSSPGPGRYRLIAELIGNRGIMVFLSDPDRVILETLRRIRGTERELVPGETYTFPPPMKKTPLDEATRELLAGTDRLETLATPEELARHLTATFAGLSRDMAQEVLARAGLSDATGGLADTDGEDRVVRIWHSLEELVRRVRARDWTPCIGRSQDGRARVLSAVPVHSLPAAQVERHESASVAVERFYEERMAEEAFKQRLQKVQRALRDEIRRLERLTENLGKDLVHVEQEEEYRRYGELITSHLARLKAGSTEAQVEDYFSGDREVVSIPMKPNLSPAENARWYFRQARKARDGRKAVAQRIARARKRLEEVTGIREKLGCGDDEERLEKAHRACIRLDLVKAPRETGTSKTGASKRPRKKAGQDIHPRRYLTSSGHLLLVGRNSRENEALTKSAAPDDIWLHARNLGGSHVILRREDKTQMPSRKTLHEAACLAAWYSKGRGSTTVPVDYTERRYVRKMKNGSPGQVVFTREKTLFVEPGLALRQADTPGTA